MLNFKSNIVVKTISGISQHLLLKMPLVYISLNAKQLKISNGKNPDIAVVTDRKAVRLKTLLPVRKDPKGSYN
jgi:hypothetical protein